MTSQIDIFVSYKREERSLALDVVQVLEAAGYRTVTDLNIQKSADFGDAIDQMISEARLVLVLWTPASVASDWVRMEALEANKLGKYFGVFAKPIAPEDLPLELRRKQYLDLSDRATRDYARIVQDVTDLIGPAEVNEAEATAASGQLNADFYLFQMADSIGYAEGYDAYLRDFPSGIFADRAREKLDGAASFSDAKTQALTEEVTRWKSLATAREQKLKETSAPSAPKPFVAARMLSAEAVFVLSVGLILGIALALLEPVQEVLGLSPTTAASPATPSDAPEAEPSNQLTYSDLPRSIKCTAENYLTWALGGVAIQKDDPFVVSANEHEEDPGGSPAVGKGPGLLVDHRSCVSTQATTLTIRGRDFEDISVLAHMPKLQTLNILDTCVQDLYPLEDLKSLRHLKIRQGDMETLEPVAALTDLRSLDLERAGVPKFSLKGSLPKLHYYVDGFGREHGNRLIDNARTRQEAQLALGDASVWFIMPTNCGQP